MSKFMGNIYGRVWGVALVSLIIYWLVMFLPIKAKQLGDSDFHEEAKAIAAYLHGTVSFEELSITKAPGPVLYYVLPYFLAGPSADTDRYWKAGVAWTAILTTLTLAVLYIVINSRLGAKVANIYMALLFVIPLHAYYSTGILAEGMAFLGVCWTLIGLLLLDRTAKFYICFALGIATLVLARPNAGLVIPLTVAIGGYAYWRGKDRAALRPVISSIAAFIIIAGVALFAKALPNKRDTLKQGEYLSFVMHHGRFQFRTEPFDWRFWDNKTRPDSKDYQAWLASTDSLNQKVKSSGLSYSDVYYNWIIADLVQHPFMLAKQFTVRLFFGNTLQISSRPRSEFGSGVLDGNTLYWTFHIIINIVNYAMLTFAMYYIYTERAWQHTWPLFVVVLALWLFHGLIYMEQRYLFPLRPIILFWSALGLVSFTKRSGK